MVDQLDLGSERRSQNKASTMMMRDITMITMKQRTPMVSTTNKMNMTKMANIKKKAKTGLREAKAMKSTMRIMMNMKRVKESMGMTMSTTTGTASMTKKVEVKENSMTRMKNSSMRKRKDQK